MKLKLKTDEFSNLLKTVLPAVSSRSTLPALSHFLIEAKDSILKIYATDLEIGISSSIETDVEKEGSCTTPARNLTDMVNALDSEKFSFKKVTDSHYEVSSDKGDTTYTIVTGEKEEFPVVPEVKGDNFIEIDAELFKDAIDKTIFSVSKDESRYVLCGAFFEVNGDSFKMVATDGRRLSFYKDKVIKKTDEFSAIIPTKAINVIERAISSSGEDKIRISKDSGENQIYFILGNTVIYSRMIEGDYPNYSQVIPDNPTKEIVVDNSLLLNATKKMLAVTTERAIAVEYKFSNNKAVVSVNTETGSGKSTIEVDYDGDEIDIAFNPDFMISNLKSIRGDKIKLGLTSSINPGKITSESDDENYIGVIMPMRP